MNNFEYQENIEVKHKMDGRIVYLEGHCVWNYDDFNNPEAEIKEIQAFDEEGIYLEIKPENRQEAEQAILKELFNYIELSNGGY